MSIGHFPPFFWKFSEYPRDIFLLFLKICQNDSKTFSSFFFKICKNGHRTFTSFLWNFVKMSIWNSEKFSKKRGKCLTVILTCFQKRRKISHCHSDKFSKTGGKCPTVILTCFQKKEENVPPSFWRVFEKQEENVRLSFWHVFTKRRKMSHRHSDKFSQKGGKCATDILTCFHKKEVNVLPSFCQVFKKKGGKCPTAVHCHSVKFSQNGGKCHTVSLTSFYKKEGNVTLSFWQIFKKWRKTSYSHSDKFSQKGGECPDFHSLDMGGKFSWNHYGRFKSWANYVTGILSPGSNLFWENFLLGGLIVESLPWRKKSLGNFLSGKSNPECIMSWEYCQKIKENKMPGELMPRRI